MAAPLVLMTQPKKMNLAHTIDLAASGTTSKTLLEERGVKQILFSMDEGQEMSSHSSSFPASVHVLEGRLRFELEKETFDLGPNDWLMMPSGAKHALTALSPMRFLLTLFKGAQ